MPKISDSIKFGWNKVKENMEISIFSTLLVLAVGALTGGKGFARSFLTILATIFLMIVRIGYNKIYLRMSDGDKPKFSDIFKEYPLFWKFLGVSILFPLTVIGGLILLIVPGIIWAVRFSFSPLILVDTKRGVIASMKESFAITRGSFWNLFLFWIAIAILNLLGLLVFGIGLLITVPVSTFAAIHVYRELTKSKAGVSTTTASSPISAV